MFDISFPTPNKRRTKLSIPYTSGPDLRHIIPSYIGHVLHRSLPLALHKRTSGASSERTFEQRNTQGRNVDKTNENRSVCRASSTPPKPENKNKQNTHIHIHAKATHLFQGLYVPQRVPRWRDKVTTPGSVFPVPTGGSPRQDPDPYGTFGVCKLGQDGVGLVTPGSLFVVVMSKAETATRATAPPPERSRRFGIEPAARARWGRVGWSVGTPRSGMR